MRWDRPEDLDGGSGEVHAVSQRERAARRKPTDIVDWRCENGHRWECSVADSARGCPSLGCASELVIESWGRTEHLPVAVFDPVIADPEFEQDVENRKRWLHIQDQAKQRFDAETLAWEPPEATTATDLLAEADSEVAWSVERLAEHGHNILFAAEYKAGKTTVGLNLAKALIGGEPFLGQFDARLEGRFVWLNYELTRNDARDWIRRQGLDTDRLVVVGLRGRPNPFRTAEGVDWLAGMLEMVEAGFLFVDTFRASFNGDNSNDNAQVARFTSLLDEVKHRADVPGLLLTHHFGRKEHESGREHGLGAVELDSWADTRWLLTREGDDRFLKVEGRVDGLEESRLDWDSEARAYRLPEERLDRHAAKSSNLRSDVLLAVNSEPGVNTRGVEARVSGRKEDVGAALRRLVADGRVVAVRGPNNSKRHFLPKDAPRQTDLGLGD